MEITANEARKHSERIEKEKQNTKKLEDIEKIRFSIRKAISNGEFQVETDLFYIIDELKAELEPQGFKFENCRVMGEFSGYDGFRISW